MKHYIYSILLLTASFTITAQTVPLKYKSATGSGSWITKQVKTAALTPGFIPNSNPQGNLSRFGFPKHLQVESTGFFYTKKIADRWFLVDPDGYVGINIAVTSVNGVASSTEITQAAYDRLRELGFNGTGNFLDNETQTRTYNSKTENSEKQFSYTRKLNFFLNYKNVRGNSNYYPNTPAAIKGSLDYVFVLDPKFIDYCDLNIGRAIANYKNEPGLLGYFTDNEINFNQDQLYNFLYNLPTDDPSYEAALNFISQRGFTKDQIRKNDNDTINISFAGYMAQRYYKITDSIIKKYDTNHLNLGSRLHGRPRAIEKVVKAAAKYCDIVSVNFYDKFAPDDQITSNSYWVKWIDKPCMVTEFYSKGDDAKALGYALNYHGAGYVVPTQQDRGIYYQNTTIELLQSKNFVGWHYFKYIDGNSTSGDGSNKGLYAQQIKDVTTPLVDENKEYKDFTPWVKELNEHAYTLIDLFYPGTIGTSVNTSKSDFNIPFEYKNKQFFIKQRGVKYAVYSSMGRILVQGIIDSPSNINLQPYTQGIYLIVLSCEGKIQTLKIIV